MDFSGFTTKTIIPMPPQVETGSPTSEGCQPPARARNFWQPNLFRAAQKIPCYVLSNIKIRLMTNWKRASLNAEDTYGYVLSLGNKSKAFNHPLTGYENA